MPTPLFRVTFCMGFPLRSLWSTTWSCLTCPPPRRESVGDLSVQGAVASPGPTSFAVLQRGLNGADHQAACPLAGDPIAPPLHSIGGASDGKAAVAFPQLIQRRRVSPDVLMQTLVIECGRYLFGVIKSQRLQHQPIGLDDGCCRPSRKRHLRTVVVPTRCANESPSRWRKALSRSARSRRCPAPVAQRKGATPAAPG